VQDKCKGATDTLDRELSALLGAISGGYGPSFNALLTFCSVIEFIPAEKPHRQLLIATASMNSRKKSRLPNVEQPDVLTPLPEGLHGYVQAWRAATPAAAGAEWRCEIVDLRQLFAAQPFVFTDHATERVDQLDLDNLEGVAAFTLPHAVPSQIAGQFDFAKQAYVFASPNPNLRILGNWSGQVQGQPVFGFVVGTVNSFMNVGIFKGRVFLRDGYHRAFGLLSRGINNVPVLVREYTAFEHLGFPQGMLPQDAYLGESPPRLTDYQNDEVAISVDRPATQKLLVIQGNELTATR
jgi:hypothetical protein